MMNIYVFREKKGNGYTDMSPPTHSDKAVTLSSRREREQVCGHIHRLVMSPALSSALSFFTSSPSHLDCWQDAVPVWR